jgi:glyoxylase-like metal-dependent hydrolase (beta-lactamase superfamily II)
MGTGFGQRGSGLEMMSVARRLGAGRSFVVAALLAAPLHVDAQANASYDVFAVRYATLPDYPVRNLVAGADTSRSADLAMMVWVLRSQDRIVLVDAGFYRQKFIDRWHPKDFLRPSEAIAKTGLAPEDVTDVVVTHVHWDHLDGVDLFTRARVWVQREEYEQYVGADGGALERTIDPEDAQALFALRTAGRLELVEGDDIEILPGIRVYTGGKHTFASQYVGVHTAAGTVILASDNVYLYENLERHVPIAQTLDAASNLAAQDRMGRLAHTPELIVPGHDADVFRRFPSLGGGVARIRPLAGPPRAAHVRNREEPPSPSVR